MSKGVNKERFVPRVSSAPVLGVLVKRAAEPLANYGRKVDREVTRMLERIRQSQR